MTNNKNKIMKNTGNVLTAFILVFPFILKAYTGHAIMSIPSPGSYPAGIAFDGKNLWVADRKDKKIYCIDKDNGKIIRSIPSPAYWPVSMTWDGEALWCSDFKGGLPLTENYNGKVYRINTENGNILKDLKSPATVIRGIAWDKKYLWCIDAKSDKIIQFNPDDGTEIYSFPAPTADCSGLAFDGKYLWVTDSNLAEIYMVDPNNGIVIIITQAPGSFTNSLCFDGLNLWATDLKDKRIYLLNSRDNDKYRTYNPRRSNLCFSHEVTNFGPGLIKTLDVQLAIPVDRDNQSIEGAVKYSPAYSDIITDKWGQKTAHFHSVDIPAGTSKTIEMKLDVTTYNLRYFIFPENVGSLNEIPAETKIFLADDEKYQINHPVIQKALKEAIGDEKNPYWIARGIYKYVGDHLFYEMSGGWNTAPTVLARGNGSCSEYTFVFISMCRAAGIPARYVGSSQRYSDVYYDDVYHRWTEIYLPDYGWIPVDPTIGDTKYPRDQANCFGFVGNSFFITTQSGGGSETMKWTYNSNESYSTEPKTFVAVDNFADWKPIDK